MECDAALGTRICAGKKAQGKDKGCVKIQWAIGIHMSEGRHGSIGK